MRGETIWRLVLAGAIAAGIGANEVQARKVYSPQVEGGEVELEGQLDLRRKPGASQMGWRQQLEIAGAPIDGLHLGAYAIYERADGGPWQRSAWKFELILESPWPCWVADACGVYLEWLRPRAESSEIEGKLLLEWLPPGASHRLNLLFGASVRGGAISQGYAWRSAFGWKEGWAIGWEAYGALGTLRRWRPLSEQEHLIGPIVAFERGDLEVEAGYLADLNAGMRYGNWKLNFDWRF